MPRFCPVLLSLCLAGATLSAAEDPLAPLPASAFTLEHARHLLFRAGFGGSPEEVQRLHRLGLEGMVDALVDYHDVPDGSAPIRVAPPSREDLARLRGLDEQGRQKLRNELRRKDAQEFQRLRAWWVERMLRTRRPLEERMTLFWHGHFTSSYRDVRNAAHMHAQNETLRRHATGSFRDLLHAISKDPAMLEYLDNNRNRKGRPNENYAREVMELFTLGLGEYTEKDIKEAARSFTGWTFDRFGTEFRFDRRQHDFGVKSVLGTNGRLSGDDTLDILLAHDACAPFVASKIWAYFAHDAPDEQLVRALGDELRRSEYRVAPLLRRIFCSREFYSERSRAAQVKSPIVFLVSTVRMFGMNPAPAPLVVQAAGRLGQDLMAPPNVKGWEGGIAWITTATLLDRHNVCGLLLTAGQGDEATRFARALSRWDSGFSARALAQMLEAGDAAALVDGFAERYLLVPLPAERRAALVDFVTGQDGSTPLDLAQLGSAASETKLRQLLHLLVSTPEFQVL